MAFKAAGRVLSDGWSHLPPVPCITFHLWNDLPLASVKDIISEGPVSQTSVPQDSLYQKMFHVAASICLQ